MHVQICVNLHVWLCSIDDVLMTDVSLHTQPHTQVYTDLYVFAKSAILADIRLQTRRQYHSKFVCVHVRACVCARVCIMLDLTEFDVPQVMRQEFRESPPQEMGRPLLLLQHKKLQVLQYETFQSCFCMECFF